MPRIDNDIKLDFKDVLFRPKRSRIRSRADVSSRPDSRFEFQLELPLTTTASVPGTGTDSLTDRWRCPPGPSGGGPDRQAQQPYQRSTIRINITVGVTEIPLLSAFRLPVSPLFISNKKIKCPAFLVYRTNPHNDSTCSSQESPLIIFDIECNVHVWIMALV